MLYVETYNTLKSKKYEAERTVRSMKEQSVRRLSRKELLEILVTQSKQIEELEAKLQDAQRQLERRELILQEAGTMAEAAMKLNHLFEDADAACRQYVESFQAMVKQNQENMTERRESGEP
jgi:hypothetical protein